MKRKIARPVLGLALLLSSAAVFAGEWRFFPVMDADYKADLTASAAGGILTPQGGSTGTYVGAEVAFNCLALQPPSGIIRTKLSYGELNHDGLKLSTLELNPRWTISAGDALTAGFGPGLGLVKAQAAGRTTSMAALQLGADLDYRIGKINLGLGARWQDTTSKDIAPGRSNANNLLVAAKVGYVF